MKLSLKEQRILYIIYFMYFDFISLYYAVRILHKQLVFSLIFIFRVLYYIYLLRIFLWGFLIYIIFKSYKILY
jgi:hypothetical protein